MNVNAPNSTLEQHLDQNQENLKDLDIEGLKKKIPAEVVKSIGLNRSRDRKNLAKDAVPDETYTGTATQNLRIKNFVINSLEKLQKEEIQEFAVIENQTCNDLTMIQVEYSKDVLENYEIYNDILTKLWIDRNNQTFNIADDSISIISWSKESPPENRDDKITSWKLENIWVKYDNDGEETIFFIEKTQENTITFYTNKDSIAYYANSPESAIVDLQETLIFDSKPEMGKVASISEIPIDGLSAPTPLTDNPTPLTDKYIAEAESKNQIDYLTENELEVDEKGILRKWWHPVLTEELFENHDNSEIYLNNENNKTYADIYNSTYNLLRGDRENHKIDVVLPEGDIHLKWKINFTGWTFDVNDGTKTTIIPGIYEMASNYIIIYRPGWKKCKIVKNNINWDLAFNAEIYQEIDNNNEQWLFAEDTKDLNRVTKNDYLTENGLEINEAWILINLNSWEPVLTEMLLENSHNENVYIKDGISFKKCYEDTHKALNTHWENKDVDITLPNWEKVIWKIDRGNLKWTFDIQQNNWIIHSFQTPNEIWHNYVIIYSNEDNNLSDRYMLNFEWENPMVAEVTKIDWTENNIELANN